MFKLNNDGVVWRLGGIKALEAKLDNLSSIPGPYRVEREIDKRNDEGN